MLFRSLCLRLQPLPLPSTRPNDLRYKTAWDIATTEQEFCDNLQLFLQVGNLHSRCHGVTELCVACHRK